MKKRVLRLFLGICYICLVSSLLITHIQGIFGQTHRVLALLEALALALFAGIVLFLYVKIGNGPDDGKKTGAERESAPEGGPEASWGKIRKAPEGGPEASGEKERAAPAAVDTEEEFARRMRPYTLSKRELEVAWLLYRGYTNRQIGEELFIAETTVKKHVTHIYEKMRITGRKAFRERVKRPEGE